MSIARPHAWLDRSAGSPLGQLQPPLPLGAAERVAAAVADAISLGADLVEEALEQGAHGHVGLQRARTETADRHRVGGDVGRLPRREGGRAVVPVAVPAPSFADPRRRRDAPAGCGRLVVERDDAPGDIARLDLLRRAAGRARREHPRRVVERLGDRRRGRERPHGGAGHDGDRGRRQTEDARRRTVHQGYVWISAGTPVAFIWKRSRCGPGEHTPLARRCRTPSLGWPA